MTSLHNPVPDWAKQLSHPKDKRPAWLRAMLFNRWRWFNRQHPKAKQGNKEGK